MDEQGLNDSAAPRIASAVPDTGGRVVFDESMLPASGSVFILLDDSNGDDAWAPTSTGPYAAASIVECISAPAITRERGDVYLSDVGFGPGSNVSGMVILVLADSCGRPAVGVGIETAPDGVTGYFSADRLRVSPSSGTTAASAVLTVAATYCSPLCLNITCSCAEPNCGPRNDYGGQLDGFHIAKMLCDPP